MVAVRVEVLAAVGDDRGRPGQVQVAAVSCRRRVGRDRDASGASCRPQAIAAAGIGVHSRVVGHDLAAVPGCEAVFVRSDLLNRELAFVVAPVVEAAEGEEIEAWR